MKNKKSIVAIGVVGLGVGLTAVGFYTRADAFGGTTVNIDGSWWVVPEIAGSFRQALATFNYDGTVIETPDASAALSTGHGAWASLGNRNYEAKVVYFRFDDMGNLIGTTEAISQVRLNGSGDYFNGRFRVHVMDVNDKVLESFDGLVTAHRIKARG